MIAKRGSPDYIIFYTVLCLLGLGIIMVYSASAVSANVNFDDSCYFLKRQLIWAGLGILAMFFTMNVDYHVWQKFSKSNFDCNNYFIDHGTHSWHGQSGNGARRWLGFGSIYIQPSEIAKLSMVLLVHYYLAKMRPMITNLKKRLCLNLAVLIGYFLA